MPTVTKKNMLTYLRFDHYGPTGKRFNLYRCECGTEKVIRQDNVTPGRESRTVSCGCHQRNEVYGRGHG